MNIVLWHLPLIRYSLVVLVICWYIWVFHFLVSLLFIVTTRVLFKLHTSLSFMKGGNMLRLIVILLAITFNTIFLPCLLFLLLYRLQTCLPLAFVLSIFGGELLMLLAATLWVCGRMFSVIYLSKLFITILELLSFFIFFNCKPI